MGLCRLYRTNRQQKIYSKPWFLMQYRTSYVFTSGSQRYRTTIWRNRFTTLAKHFFFSSKQPIGSNNKCTPRTTIRNNKRSLLRWRKLGVTLLFREIAFRAKSSGEVGCFISVKNAHTMFSKLFYCFVVYFTRSMYVVLLKRRNTRRLTFLFTAISIVLTTCLTFGTRKPPPPPEWNAQHGATRQS